MSASRKKVLYDSKVVKNLGAVTSTSLSITIGSNGSRCLVLVLCSRSGGTISSASVGGKALQRAVKSPDFDGCFADIWYVVNPPTGPKTVSVTFSEAVSDRSLISAISIYGVDQGNPIDATDSLTGSGSSFSNSFTVENDDSMAIDGQFNAETIAGNPNSGQVLIHRRNDNDSGGISYELVDAGTEAMGWNSLLNASTPYSQAVAVFRPARQPSALGLLAGLL